MLEVNLRPRTRAASPESSMRTQPTLGYARDEELGKRDDDFRPMKRTSTATSFMQPWKWRKRRLATVLAIAVVLYLFWTHLGANLGTIEQRVASASHVSGSQAIPSNEPSGAPPRTEVAEEDEQARKRYYNGPVRYYRLASSLQNIQKTLGIRVENRNVMFAVSSLRSAANLLPMACEMARWDRNFVHFVFFGRDPLPLEDILEINGVTKKDCVAYFHDARADYSEYSSDERAAVAVAGAMKHVNDFMHPQAMIMDDSKLEDEFFTQAMRFKADESGRPLIEVPAGRYEQFMWMTRLDSGSLKNWFKASIDILIHCPPDSSGGLARLIKSLSTADYSGFPVPKLTVELPSNPDPFALNCLERVKWPPNDKGDPFDQSTLILRHRIPSAKLKTEEASIRFVESFYPTNPLDNHILILSPQAEVSSLYLQYLMYTILEYKYSSYSPFENHNLLGISLDVPSTFINGSGTFTQPLGAQMPLKRHSTDERFSAISAPFLYQAPSSTAALVFGEKWSMFHDFLTKRLRATHLGKAEKTKKLVAETEPAWMEYLFELMRVKGWAVLQPALPLVTVHNELAQVPEEFVRGDRDGSDEDAVTKPAKPDEQPYLEADALPALSEHVERDTDGRLPLHELLPFDGDLPELIHLPYISNAGVMTNSTTNTDWRTLSAPLFRRLYGGCSSEDALRNRMVKDGTKTDDLFCLPGMEIEYDDGDYTAPSPEPEVAPEADRAARIAAMSLGKSAPVSGPGVAGGGSDARFGYG